MMLAKISVANFSCIPIANLKRYGAQAKPHQFRCAFSLPLKRAFSSWIQLKASPCRTNREVAQECDGRATLLSFKHATRSSFDCCTQPILPDGSHTETTAAPLANKAVVGCVAVNAGAAYPAHLQRHDGGGILSKTENLVFRTKTTPGKAMRLQVSVGPRLPGTVDLRPMPEEATPLAPTAVHVDKKQYQRIAKAAKKQIAMLAPWSTCGIGNGAVKVAFMDVLTHPEALQGYASSLFCSHDQGDALMKLLQALHLALQSHGTALPLSAHVMVLQHLAYASAGDAERALAALHALQYGDFLALPADASQFMPRQCLPRSSPAQAHLDALSVAAKMSLMATEFKALLKLIGPKFGAPQQRSLKRLLGAVAQIEIEQGQQVDLWHHVLRAALDVESGQASLAQVVLHIESVALQRVDDAYANLSTAQKSALFSWNNGFRQRGKGSDLALAQARLCKLVKYVERANHAQELRNVRLDRHRRVQSAFTLIDAKTRLVTARLNQSIGRKKSPLMALASLGANNARLMHPEDELQVLYSNTEVVIGLLHAQLQEALSSMPAKDVRQQLQDPFAPLPALVEHTALLAHWMILMAQHTPLGHRLDTAAVREITYTVAKEYGCLVALTTLENKLKHWIGRELKISDLHQWATLHLAFANEPDSDADTAPVAEDKLSKALRRAVAADTASSYPRDLSPQAMHAFMRGYLCEHNTGNTVSAINGGALGLNTTPLMLSIKKVNECLGHVLPLTATPAIDARLLYTRNAVINMGSTTHGFEVFIGTQKQTSGALGAALNFSTSPLLRYVGANAGCGVAAALGCDRVQTRGVMVRTKRGISADGNSLDTPQARAEIVAFTDLMFAIAKGEYGALPATSVWEKMAERFYDSDTLSVGWQTQRELTPHLTGTAGLYARLGFGIDRAGIAYTGLSVSRTADFTPTAAISRKETSGATRQIRSSNFTRHQQIISIGAAGAGAAVPVHTSGTNTESLSFPQMTNTLNFLASDAGTSAIFRTLMEQGELSSPFTLRDMEQRDTQHFCKLLQQPERYAQYLQIFNARYGVENGEKKLAEFMEKTRNWAGPGQRHLMRSRLKADVHAKLNELIALADTDHRFGVESTVQKEIAEAMQHLLCAEASWMATEIMTLETQTARNAKGINFGAQLAAQDAVISDRELSHVGVPLPVADKWIGARVRGA